MHMAPMRHAGLRQNPQAPRKYVHKPRDDHDHCHSTAENAACWITNRTRLREELKTKKSYPVEKEKEKQEKIKIKIIFLSHRIVRLDDFAAVSRHEQKIYRMGIHVDTCPDMQADQKKDKKK